MFYRPALSTEVHEAFFGFFRRQRDVPEFLTMTNCSRMKKLDWEEIFLWMDGKTNYDSYHEIDCVWTLAQYLQKSFNYRLADVEFCNGLTHGKSIPQLIQDVEMGKFYRSFLVLVTILERALYDKYAALTSGGKSNMILRDLLHSPELGSYLPAGYMRVLHVLFLPSGLNIRNLLWHGFLAPFEMPSSLCYLIIYLLGEPCLELPTPRESHFSQLPAYSIQSTPKALREELLTARSCLDTDLPPQHSSIVRSRLRLIENGIDSFLSEQYLSSLFLTIPVLEHYIRCEFVYQNQPIVPIQMACAQLKEYYSTLDGFGQRHQHQVLLAKEIFATKVPLDENNRLYEKLPPGALQICLDLFMASAGPNIRAKLCHGEIELNTLTSDSSYHDCIESCALMVLVLVLKLCCNKTILPLLEEYDCHFHPYNLLGERLKETKTLLNDMEILLKAFTYTTTASAVSPDSTEWIWTSISDTPIHFIDKTSRMLPTLKTWNGKSLAFDSVLDGIQILTNLLQSNELILRNHFDLPSWFLSRDDAVELTPLTKLDLNSVQPLAASGCMLAILDACKRLIVQYSTRLRNLKQIVIDGQAHTSHRRSLVTLVSFASCYQQIIALSCSIIEHQVRASHDKTSRRCCGHFESMATKLLQFIVAIEDDKKSTDKLVQMALQYWNSKAVRLALHASHALNERTG